MELDKNFLERIEKIDWFSNCGKDLPTDLSVDYPLHKIDNWKTAKKYYTAPLWEEVQTIIKNVRITNLTTSGRSVAEWNEANTLVGKTVDEILAAKFAALQEQQKLDKQIVKDARRHTIMAVMEHQFQAAKIHPFGLNLLKIYEAGHLPCGWEGARWPEGQLVVL